MVAPRTERDPEDRVIDASDRNGKREKMFDKTIADSFPASDPPSTVPDPHEDSFPEATETPHRVRGRGRGSRPRP